MNQKHLFLALLLAACRDPSTQQMEPVTKLANCREAGTVSNAFSLSLTHAAWRSNKIMTVFTFKNIETSPRSIEGNADTGAAEHLTFVLTNNQGVEYTNDQIAELPTWTSQPVFPGRSIDIPGLRGIEWADFALKA